MFVLELKHVIIKRIEWHLTKVLLSVIIENAESVQSNQTCITTLW